VGRIAAGAFQTVRSEPVKFTGAQTLTKPLTGIICIREGVYACVSGKARKKASSVDRILQRQE
jgi:hypothetical protein